MKILLVADYELRELWDYWDTAGKKRTEGVELILSAGDIKPEYLEFLVTMLNVPCLYVRGNHDGMYDEKPPMGCIDIDGKVFELKVPVTADHAAGNTAAGNNNGSNAAAINFNCNDATADRAATGNDAAGQTQPSDPGSDGSDYRTIRIAGLGGSMRYHKGGDMYTEREMRNRVRKLLRRIRLGLITGIDEKTYRSSELSDQARAMGINPFTKRRRVNTAAPQAAGKGPGDDVPAEYVSAEEMPAPNDRGPVDIFLTHAPCFGYGDLEDLPHTGFKCFNRFHELVRPAYHCYGHVHREYNVLMPKETEHPAGAHLINVGGMYILDI